jgi:hypothetical protein
MPHLGDHFNANEFGDQLVKAHVSGASAKFAGVGIAASDIRYHARVSSSAAPERIAELLRQTDAVAEIHNTVRAGVPVTLEP